jgi:toxin ParE1/3/4
VKSARYHPAARDELRAAIRHDEAERPGRGALLEAAVSTLLRRVRRLPRSAPLWPSLPTTIEGRRVRVTRHPYLLVFAVLADYLVVIAVAHMSRRPGYWLMRVDDVGR